MSHGQAKEIADDLVACGCGMPCDALQMVLDVLETYVGEGFCDSGLLEQRLLDSGTRYFVLYQLDRVALIEHGSSVPGWLTEKGRTFRNVLRNMGVEAFDRGILDYSTGEVVDCE